MTIAEFNATGWTPGMTADYQGKTYPIASCDFEEQLVGLHRVLEDAPDDIVWVRCENVTVYKPDVAVSGPAVAGTLHRTCSASGSEVDRGCL